ncbi:polysaccharide biosynthesis/export family protein [Pontibacter pamirensis]|uniref:polysaccharide biosynthesis/export family protein n=1 Tax=Pontibacter pamirensis TaxID=2562824 RepID=UPI001389C451|nr:polysaccharide biosynthesis/export family protein [Pontibacter pamirensis]
MYTLKKGDVLSINVKSTTPAEFNFLSTVAAGAGDPVLSGYTIDAEGNILLPVIGKVNLGGLTVSEAREKITENLLPHLSNPTVTVRLLTFKYTILGEVSGQGQYTTYQDNINIMEAIATAGGFSPYSNRGRIRLVRYENGQAKLYTLNLLADNTLAASNFFLQPNDMIVVDPLPAKFVRENIVANVGLTLGLVSTMFFLIDRLTR